jgi:integrase/recombinase XerD
MNQSPSNFSDLVTALKARAAGKPDWSDAIGMWLGLCKSASTQKAYAKSLEDLLSSTAAPVWEIVKPDIIRWRQKMEKAGLSPATIQLRLAGVSSFYRFAMQECTKRDESGREVQLIYYNPAKGKSLRPNVETYGKASWMSAEEASALLKAIHNRGTLQSTRDYALFLGFLLLAGRNREWSTACWGDFEKHGDTVLLCWKGKGRKDQKQEIPMPVWNAVCDYLRAGGRLNKMRDDNYIFTALRRAGQKLPNGATIEENQPLSSSMVGRLLRHYLRLAGIEPKHITPHSLRHTGAMLYKAAGSSNQEIMQYLGRANLSNTQKYLHVLESKQESHWMRVGDLLGLNEDSPKHGKVFPRKRSG